MRDDAGTTSAEYAIIVSLIAAAVIVVVAAVGNSVNELFTADWPW